MINDSQADYQPLSIAKINIVYQQPRFYRLNMYD